ncbi:MAG: hypothetical protein HYX61_00400 [Gammaproteobacteria bacterium]|nr:hypothetical protein [Gammaproteobacteria bacterium]
MHNELKLLIDVKNKEYDEFTGANTMSSIDKSGEEKESAQAREESENTQAGEENKSNEDKFYSKMSRIEKKEIEEIVWATKSHNTDTINSYNYILYKWYFILNAGGLVGIVTLLSLSSKDNQIIGLCVILIVIFFLGILSIITANNLEITRFEKDSENIMAEFDAFKKDKSSDSYLLEKINKDSYPAHLATKFEYLSLGFFIIGIILGIVYFAFMSQSHSANKNDYKSQSQLIIRQ